MKPLYKKISEKQSKGYRASFDTGCGNSLQNEMDKAASGSGSGLFIDYRKRFCETCQEKKPKGKRKAVKGWKCDDCITNL